MSFSSTGRTSESLPLNLPASTDKISALMLCFASSIVMNADLFDSCDAGVKSMPPSFFSTTSGTGLLDIGSFTGVSSTTVKTGSSENIKSSTSALSACDRLLSESGSGSSGFAMAFFFRVKLHLHWPIV